MNFLIIFGVLLSTIALTNGRPQLTVECGPREVSPGKYSFNCEDQARSSSNNDALTLRSEHVLWIQQDGAAAQTIDVEVPNYRIDELIKAGFKGGDGGSTRVNILLKKPEQSYNAEIGEQSSSSGAPSVGLTYEPIQPILVHYPNDKPYQASSGPITPPA